MIERVRRARAAFERKTRAFQGPDWPYYEKRVIVGKKKMEPATETEISGTTQASQSQNTVSNSAVEPNKDKE
jgi:hypothetical protein